MHLLCKCLHTTWFPKALPLVVCRGDGGRIETPPRVFATFVSTKVEDIHYSLAKGAFKMNKCGYILLADKETNAQDVIKIISCPCSSIEDAPYQDNLSTYTIHKMTFKILSKDTHPSSHLSHLTLMDIAKTAVSFDKELKYPAVLTFTFDKDENANLKFKSYIKEVFPLPDKTYVYGDKKVLLNITDCFCKEDSLSVPVASVICDYLNILSVKSGLLQDRFFSHSCGRIFMDVNFFLKSLEGRRFLKNNFSHIFVHVYIYF